MKKIIISAAVLMTITASFVACKKTDKPIALNGPYASLSEVFASLAPKSKTVTLNASTGGSFFGNSGTRYTFSANSFINASGTVVSGNIDLEVLECVSESDMIFSKMLTVSNGTPLISAGEILVKASQAGASLNIRPGYAYSVNMPTNKGTATAGMEYFSGSSSSSLPGSIVNWNLGIRKDSFASVIYNGDTISMFPDSVGFKNLDKYASSDFATVDIKIDGFNSTLKQDDFTSYIVLDGLLSAAPLYSSNLSGNTIKNVKVLKLNAHYVFCGVYNGDFYGGILKDIIAVNGNTYTITVSKMTPPAFKVLVDALK